MQQAGQILAIKRSISLRPTREDHPHFDGGNVASRFPKLPNIVGRKDAGGAGFIAAPYWELVGPWDVDNDNDGVPDSVWVDLGDPVAQAEDGTLYKPMYAFLIVDLDSRLNVNAHGTVDDVKPGALALIENPPGSGRYVPGANLAGNIGSDFLPRGLGYGTAEISLRPILSPNLPGSTLAANVGNPGFNGLLDADDYARLLFGRPADTTSTRWQSEYGRHGSVDIWGGNAAALSRVKPGTTYNGTPANPPGQPQESIDLSTVNLLTMYKNIGYPHWLSDYYLTQHSSAFGTPSDLSGRYALGLDPAGQPIVEAKGDGFLYGDRSLLYNSPYELNLAEPRRRELPAASVVEKIKTDVAAGTAVTANDDAPFATSDLERILRAYDADAARASGPVVEPRRCVRPGEDARRSTGRSAATCPQFV